MEDNRTDFQIGIDIVLCEAACNILCSSEGGEEGYQIGADKWNDVYERGAGYALEVLKGIDREEALGTVRDEIECEELLEDCQEEAIDVISKMLEGEQV